MGSPGYAVVDFFKNKAADGTTPCEIVHMSWVSADLRTCFWPGTKSYASAFKKGAAPQKGWQSFACRVKLFSDSLDAVKTKRDELLLDGSSSSALESDLEKSGRFTGEKRVISSILNASSRQDFSDSSESEHEQRSRTKKLCRNSLPPAPHFSSAVFQLVHEKASEPSGTTSTKPDDDAILICDLSTNGGTQQLESRPSTSSTGIGTPHRHVSLLDKSVLRRMERMERKVDDILDLLTKQKPFGVPFVEKPENCPELPIKELSSVKIFDVYLSLESHTEEMVPFLAKTGGSGEKEATERVMAAILSENVASRYNMMGRVRKDHPPKVAFIKHRFIMQLVKQTVRVMEREATDKGIEAAIMYWLKHAKRRVPKSDEDNSFQE